MKCKTNVCTRMRNLDLCHSLTNGNFCLLESDNIVPNTFSYNIIKNKNTLRTVIVLCTFIEDQGCNN